MNYLVVGKNGSGKSYFVVHLTKKFKDQNDAHLNANALFISKNFELLIDRDPQKSFEKFAENLELLKSDNPKVYAPYDDVSQLISEYSVFQKMEDGENFDDYFRFHIIYNDFIKYLSQHYQIKLDLLKPVHCLFSDINGIKIETVRPSPEDWRTAPLGSKIFYDEFQDRPEYLFDGNRPSKNPMILELSKIRHYDIDLYLITPDPDNLHKSLRKIVHVMYFIKRPHGNPNCCSVYTFDQFLSNPRAAADSKREPKKYASYELLTYKKSIQRLYTSAANHSSMKFVIPWKWIRNAVLIFIGFSIIISMLFKIPIFSFFVDAVKGMFGDENAVSALKDPNQISKEKNNTSPAATESAVSPEIQKKVKSCMDQIGWTEQQCLESIDPSVRDRRHADMQQSTRNDMETVVFDYNPNNPFRDLSSSVSYEVSAKPIFSGCMKKHGRYVAYTQQGTILKNVSQDDCRRVIEEGDRPFNYFQQPQQQVQQLAQQSTLPERVSTSDSGNSNIETSSL